MKRQHQTTVLSLIICTLSILSAYNDPKEDFLSKANAFYSSALKGKCSELAKQISYPILM